jgi:hypothetical protein
MSMSATTGVMFITAVLVLVHGTRACLGVWVIVLDGWYTGMYNSVTNPVRVRTRQVVFVR